MQFIDLPLTEYPRLYKDLYIEHYAPYLLVCIYRININNVAK